MEDGVGSLDTSESKDHLARLEKRKHQLLKEKEVAWHIKSRDIWIKSGDDNTKYFEAYAWG